MARPPKKAPADKARAPRSGPASAVETLRDDFIALKRDRILEEAAALFYERGYLQTTVDAIAERLGATKPFVYYHYHSKVDLLTAICERGTSDALEATDQALAMKGTPLERFEAFVRQFTKVALKNHEFVAIYFREELNLPKESAERISQMRKSINRKFKNLLSAGVASGDFAIGDVGTSALVIAGMSSYAFAWYRDQGRLDLDSVTERIVEMALKMVCNPARTTG